MGDQFLSLKWNNHQKSFTSQLAFLYSKDKFSDVTIACEEKFYPVHKLVLSTCSDYFDKMFSHMECKSPMIVLKDISQKHIEMLLNYMYLGEVNVDQADLPSLMKAAECLRIKGLAVSDNEEEKPKKRKLPFDSYGAKRRAVESSQNSSKRFPSTEKDRSSQSIAESESVKNIMKKSISPILENKDFQDIILDPIKEEKIDPPDEKYFEPSTSEFGISNTEGEYLDESFMKPDLPQQEEEYQDYPGDMFEPGPTDGSESNYSPNQQAYPTTVRQMRYCDKCSYCTIDKSNMVRHNFVHTGERPLCCSLCSFKTCYHGNLKRHELLRHSASL